MNQEKTAIEKKPFAQRFVLPAGIVLLVMIFSMLLYSNSWRIDNDTLHWMVAYVFGLVFFISIGFGSILIYPMTYFKGASATERIIASLITPIVWTIKELVRVSEFFTFGETVYYIFNSLHLIIFFSSFGLMGICELICRSVMKKRSAAPLKIITPLPVIGIIAALIALYVIFLWGVGVHWFYIYQKGYKALFH